MPEGLGVKRKHENDEGEQQQQQQQDTDEPATTQADDSSSSLHTPADADSFSPPAASDASLMPSLGSRLLAKAGYRGEGGLGKREQGAASLLPDSTQLSTHGIGFQTAAKRQRHTYTPQHHISIRITPHYLPAPATPLEPTALHPTLAPYDDTQRRLTSPNYGSIPLQQQLQEAKSYFDHIDHRSFLAARQRSNPFELIKGEMFQNRAALKMAELDTLTDRLFTTLPPTATPTAPPSLFHFADVCAGPGGFSEYMLTRWKWRAKGYGFTLRTPPATDFLPHKFNSNAPAHSFRAYYGADGTGDITSTANLRRLADDVHAEVSDGVHVCMADGGFDVTGAENKQELLSQQLILGECIAALSVVRVGGAFACKLFDCFLPFTVSLLWVLWRCWDGVAVVKPNQSRPANSERFVICKGRKSDDEVREWREYLIAVNEMIEEQKAKRRSKHESNRTKRGGDGRRTEEKEEKTVLKGEVNGNEETESADEGVEDDMTVSCVVPEEVMMADTEFMSYMRQSNDDIAQRQIAALTRIRQYVEDPNLPPDDQQTIRLDCLRYWDITDARQQHKQRLLKSQQRDRRNRDTTDPVHEGDADSVDGAQQQPEGENDVDERIGYVHYDPQWGHYHFSRHPQQGLFTLPAAEQLLPQLDEQLHSFRLLEPLPTAAEDDAYRRREETPSTVRQFHSFCDHRWQCMLVPTGSVHTFVLSTSNGSFILDDRMQPMPLPHSYPLSLPPDTILEALLYPTQLLIIDCWSLPSPPSLFPSHLWLAGERSTAEQRLQEVQLLLEAMRTEQDSGGSVRVAVGELRGWAEVSESEVGDEVDVLFVREEGKRPSVMRCWDRRECGMQWPDVQRLMGEVAMEKERLRQRKADRAQRSLANNGDGVVVAVQ